MIERASLLTRQVGRRRFLLGAGSALILPRVAQAQLFTPPPPFFNSVTPPSYAYASGPGDATSQTTYTFAGSGIGTADSTRRLVVGIMAIASGAGVATLTSVTIGGVAATVLVTGTDGGRVVTALAIAAVPTGTTATAVVVFGQSMNRCVLSIWATYNLTSAAARATASSAAKPGVLDINVLTNDILLAVAYCNGGGSSTWTGITKQFDVLVGGGLETAADTTAGSTASPRTVSVTYSSSDVERAACIASFR